MVLMENAEQANFYLKIHVGNMENMQKKLMEDINKRNQMDHDVWELNIKLESNKIDRLFKIRTCIPVHLLTTFIHQKKPVPVAMCSFTNTSAGF